MAHLRAKWNSLATKATPTTRANSPYLTNKTGLPCRQKAIWGVGSRSFLVRRWCTEQDFTGATRLILLCISSIRATTLDYNWC